MSPRKKKRPKALPLLPGLKWQGKLDILFRDAEGNYVVAFDAQDMASVRERYVFDHTVLTPKQLEDWTGWRE